MLRLRISLLLYPTRMSLEECAQNERNYKTNYGYGSHLIQAATLSTVTE